MDDAEEAGRALAPGTRWLEGPRPGRLAKLVGLEELALKDLNIPPHIRTMKEFIKKGSKFNPDIRLMGDCPSLNASKMMPALDVQIWVVCGQVKYQHYRKLMANTMVMMKYSAHPEKTKRTSPAQEGKRILKNTSQYLPWQVLANHLSDLSKRMKASGYKEQFRMEVIKSAVEGLEKMAGRLEAAAEAQEEKELVQWMWTPCSIVCPTCI